MEVDDTVRSLCDDFWAWRMKDSPEFASECGFHGYSDRWDDISVEAHEQRKEDVKDFLSKADKIDVSCCGKQSQINLELLKGDLNTYISGSDFKSYYFPINFLEGIHCDLDMLIDFHKFETEDDYRTYLHRLETLPARVLQNEVVMQKGIEEGLTSHRISVECVPDQISTLISTKPEESIFLKPFSRPPSSISSETLEKLKVDAIKAVKGLYPGFLKLKGFLENVYIKKCRPSEGLSTLKNGPAYYQQCLNFHLGCEMTPLEVHELGQKEVARIHKQIFKIVEEEGYGSDLKKFMKKLHSSEEFYFKTSDACLDFVKNICNEQIRPKLPSLFVNIPATELIFELTPPSKSNSPAAYYMAGTADGSRPGVYFINANNLKLCPKYEFMALSLHEGEPGHHMQLSYAALQKDVPAFRRYIEDMKYSMPPCRFPLHTAMVEGWGLYCESLGNELGLYTDNYSLFGKCSFEMLRATRLVVDTGIHALGWNQKQAVKYVVDHTLNDQLSVTNEVNRYITWPGQACAYKIGELKIWELRHKAEKHLGDLFDIRDFHDRVLGCGSVPLTFLQTQVEEYIKETKAGNVVP